MRLLNSAINVFGTVVKGFGRGSKELGIPTANFADDVTAAYSNELETGVYFGWARVDDGDIHKMVMSIGWNPFYKNVKKSMETHIMHKFESDFYGAKLRVSILGYLRPEADFESLDKMIETINNDIKEAESELDTLSNQKNSVFMTSPVSEVYLAR